MLGRRITRRSDDGGAVLILALMMLVVVSFIVLSIATLTMSSIRNSGNFATAQSETTAANNVTNLALESSVSTFLAATTGISPGLCWTPSTSSSSVSDPPMTAWCRTLWAPFSPQTRTVTIDTCPSTVTSGVTCAQAPFLQAVAVIDDYASSSSSSSTPTTYDSCAPVSSSATNSTSTSCGQGVTLESWAFGVSPPVIVSWGKANSSTDCPPSTPPVSITVSGSYTDPTQLSVGYISSSSISPSTGLPTPVAVEPGVVISSSVQPGGSQSTIIACGPTSGNTVFAVVTTPLGVAASSNALSF